MSGWSLQQRSYTTVQVLVLLILDALAFLKRLQQVVALQKMANIFLVVHLLVIYILASKSEDICDGLGPEITQYFNYTDPLCV